MPEKQIKFTGAKECMHLYNVMCCENIPGIFNISSVKMVDTVYSLGSSVRKRNVR